MVGTANSATPIMRSGWAQARLALGLGAAMATGQGVANAAPDDGSSSASDASAGPHRRARSDDKKPSSRRRPSRRFRRNRAASPPIPRCPNRARAPPMPRCPNRAPAHRIRGGCADHCRGRESATQSTKITDAEEDSTSTVPTVVDEPRGRDAAGKRPDPTSPPASSPVARHRHRHQARHTRRRCGRAAVNTHPASPGHDDGPSTTAAVHPSADVAKPRHRWPRRPRREIRDIRCVGVGSGGCDVAQRCPRPNRRPRPLRSSTVGPVGADRSGTDGCHRHRPCGPGRKPGLWGFRVPAPQLFNQTPTQCRGRPANRRPGW